MIIVGFSGIGKSTIANSGKYRIVDLESSWFDRTKENWYENYCQVAEHISRQGFIVFVSCHKDVRGWLKYHNIPYIVLYPDIELENEWILKLKNRSDKTKFTKDYRALERAVKHFSDDINDIIKNEPNRISINEIDYSLEGYIREAIDMYNR